MLRSTWCGGFPGYIFAFRRASNTLKICVTVGSPREALFIGYLRVSIYVGRFL